MKQVKDFESYLIGVDGKLFSLKTMKFLTKIVDKDGYIVYRIFNNKKTYTKKAHRLVAETYLSNEHNKTDVNHINGIKSDNTLFNLEWSTKSDNAKHAWNIGLQKRERNNGKIVLDCETGIFYKSCKEAAIAKGMVYDLLKHRLRGRTINNTSLKYV